MSAWTLRMQIARNTVHALPPAQGGDSLHEAAAVMSFLVMTLDFYAFTHSL